MSAENPFKQASQLYQDATIIKHEGFDLYKFKPTKPLSPIPVLVAPGLGSHPEAYQLLIYGLYNEGLTVISPAVRYGTVFERRGFEIPTLNHLKQHALLIAAHQEGYQAGSGSRQVNVVAHSKGAIDTVLAAYQSPEYFRNLILDAPSGIHPSMNPIDSIRALSHGDDMDKKDKAKLAETADEDLLKVMAINDQHSLYFRSQKFKFKAEAAISAVTRIEPYFNNLTSKGVRLTVISHLQDSMFPNEWFRHLMSNRKILYMELPGIHPEIKFNLSLGPKIAKLLKGEDPISLKN